MSNDNDFSRVPDAVVPKHRAPAIVRVLASLTGWGLVFAIALGALGFWAWSTYTAEGPLKAPRIVTIPEGASRADIAQILEDQGIIHDARVMNAASYVNAFRGGSLKPGEYEFAAGLPMSQVMNAIAAGRVLTYKLTIPEGWTTQMALARINANEVLLGDPVTSVPEGTLIADTQVFRRGMTRAKLVQDMAAAQAKLVDEIWARRPADSILKTKEEMVTLASIVEKETALAEERPRIASVFINRLKQGMRLQSDPTIIYGIVGGAGKLNRPISKADIEGKTPFNTYQIDGLPPGPIAVPGRAALEAVIAPAQTQDLFFVADGKGGHAFAATLDAHNANVAKWREAEKNGLQLPGETPEPVTPEAVVDVQQTPLPEVPTQPAAEAPPVDAPPAEAATPVATGDDAAIAAAADDATKVQPVPEPAEGGGDAQPAAAAPKPAAPPPLPVAKKPKLAAAEPAAEPEADKKPATALKPGSVIKVGSKFVPIPQIKKPKR